MVKEARIEKQMLRGSIDIQPSKSYLHRLIIVAGLLGDKLTVKNVNYSNDINATLLAMKNFGLIDYEKKQDEVVISKGNGEVSSKINCDESGSTLRFLLPVALCLNQEIKFFGNGRLLERPMDYYKNLCEELNFVFEQNQEFIKVKGNLQGDSYFVRSNVSSQFVTGMIFAMVKKGGKSKLILEGEITSKGYIDITLDVLRAFNVNTTFIDNEITIDARNPKCPKEVFCEADWSHGAFFAVAGALSNEGVELCGLNLDSLQKDKEIISVLQQFGAKVKVSNGTVKVLKGELKPLNVDVSNIPDIAPIICVLLSFAKGTSLVYNAKRLKFKESDRIQSTYEALKNMGANIEIDGDGFKIVGVDSLQGGCNVKTYSDHRIAMSAAIAGTVCERPIFLDDYECVKKSAPNFWKEFKLLRGKVDLD